MQQQFTFSVIPSVQRRRAELHFSGSVPQNHRRTYGDDGEGWVLQHKAAPGMDAGTASCSHAGSQMSYCQVKAGCRAQCSVRC